MPGGASFSAISLYLTLFGVWLTSYVDGRRRARQVVVRYLAPALISAVLGVLAILAPIPGRSALQFDGRADASFKDPNVFGPFLIPALLILLEETVKPHLLRASGWSKIVGIIMLALGVLFSYTRAAWVNLVVAVVVMLAVLLLRRRSTGTAVGILAVVLVAVVSGAGAIAITGAGSSLQKRAALRGYDAFRSSAQAATACVQAPREGLGPDSGGAGYSVRRRIRRIHNEHAAPPHACLPVVHRSGTTRQHRR